MLVNIATVIRKMTEMSSEKRNPDLNSVLQASIAQAYAETAKCKKFTI